MIHIQDVAFSYPGSDEILQQISFDLDGGHCLALLGNNGAGKSTLLKCLNLIHTPARGIIQVNGREIRSMGRKEIAQTLAYVEQQSESSQMTVYDSVLLGRKPYIRLEPTQADYAIVEKALARMELKDFALRFTDELSGGELQKVVLARALAQEPEILLLDEPTSSLDLHNQHEVMRIVSHLAEEDHLAVVVVIHDLNLALRYCDRFLLIRDGRVYAYGDQSIITAEAVSQVYRVKCQVVEFLGHKIVVVE